MSNREFKKAGPKTALSMGTPAKQIEEHHPMPGETVVFEGGQPASRKFNGQYVPGKGEPEAMDGFGLSNMAMNPY